MPKDRFVKNIKSVAHKEHKISYGELLAKYNLISFSGKNTCLFAKDYGDIVNSEPHNKAFIKHMPQAIKNNLLLTQKIANKIDVIYARLADINTKYKVIGKSELARLKNLSSNIRKSSNSIFDLIVHHEKHNHDLANLAKADALVDDIPVFLPMTDSQLTSKFGPRKLGRGKTRMHAGIDLASAAKHASVFSGADGVVLEIAASPSYGNFIMVSHKNNIKTRYAHLHKLFVYAGEKVFQGQMIGKQGSTGRSTNDHLHFEIIYQNHPIDPTGFVGNEYSCRKM